MLMRFGMGILLTPEEDEIVAPIVKPCYAALDLANDYFSFDVEWEEFQQSNRMTMTNAVRLFMKWHNIDVTEARRLSQQVTNKYEKKFQQNVANYIAGEGKDNVKLQTYLKAQGQQIPGNVAWSLRCPRYHLGYAKRLVEFYTALFKVSRTYQRERKGCVKARLLPCVLEGTQMPLWVVHLTIRLCGLRRIPLVLLHNPQYPPLRMMTKTSARQGQCC